MSNFALKIIEFVEIPNPTFWHAVSPALYM